VQVESGWSRKVEQNDELSLVECAAVSIVTMRLDR